MQHPLTIKLATHVSIHTNSDLQLNDNNNAINTKTKHQPPVLKNEANAEVP